MDSPALLLFDLGGVLIESSVFENLSKLLPEPIDCVSLKERWLFSPSVRRFELGEISPYEFAESFTAEWGIQLAPATFLKKFISWPRGFFPGARETIRLLRTRHRVACLSNSNALHWERFGNLEEDFDIALFSHLLGVIKPDREAFTLALNECGVEPAEVCFFDDSVANIHTAQSLGIRAFHVEGFKSLQDVLRVQKLLPD